MGGWTALWLTYNLYFTLTKFVIDSNFTREIFGLLSHLKYTVLSTLAMQPCPVNILNVKALPENSFIKMKLAMYLPSVLILTISVCTICTNVTSFKMFR